MLAPLSSYSAIWVRIWRIIITYQVDTDSHAKILLTRHGLLREILLTRHGELN